MGRSSRESSQKIFKTLSRRLRIIEWLPNYKKDDILADFIAGVTVGLTMMPQSIAYASLAELPAQYGLYTALMGSFIYIFFGTIKQISIGPSSLMTLLTFSYVGDLPLDYMVLLCFLGGCVELIMGILNLGILLKLKQRILKIILLIVFQDSWSILYRHQ